MILAGGLGTRLREETEFRPKPMVEIGGKPILWHIMKTYAAYGYTDFVICVGYRGNVIREYFLNYESMNNDFTLTLGDSSERIFHGNHTETDWRVTVAETGDETPTGGRLKRVSPHLLNDRFMATYGDGVGDVDLRNLFEFHQRHGRIGTVTIVRPPSRFGVLAIDEGGYVSGFREKPEGTDWVSAGFFVFEPAFLDYLTDDAVLEREPLERLAQEEQLVAYRHEGFWQPMDTYREFELLNSLWKSDPPWKVWD